jgi:hypothetical protein
VRFSKLCFPNRRNADKVGSSRLGWATGIWSVLKEGRGRSARDRRVAYREKAIDHVTGVACHIVVAGL